MFSQRKSLHLGPCWVRIVRPTPRSSARFFPSSVFVWYLEGYYKRTVLFGVEGLGHFSSAPHRWLRSMFRYDSSFRFPRRSIPAELGADPRRVSSLSSFSPSPPPHPSAKTFPIPWRTSRRRRVLSLPSLRCVSVSPRVPQGTILPSVRSSPPFRLPFSLPFPQAARVVDHVGETPAITDPVAERERERERRMDTSP